MRPKIICHMLSTVDGRLVTQRWTPPFDGKPIEKLFDPYFAVSNAFNAQGIIIGRKTVRDYSGCGDFDYRNYPVSTHTETFIGKRESPRSVIVLDPKGKTSYTSDNLDGENIIVVLSEEVPEAYLTHLRKKGISYLFAGKDGKELPKAMEVLSGTFGMETVLLEGGGVVNGSFLKAELIDELSLQIYPGIDGLAGMPAIFEYQGENGELPALGQSLELISARPLSDGIFQLHYKFHKNKNRTN